MVEQLKQIKQLKPYLTLADNLEDSNALFSYYLRKYVATKGYNFYTSIKKQKPDIAKTLYTDYLDSWMKKIEQMAKQMGNQIQLKSNMAQLIDYTEQAFLRADNEYRAKNYTTQLTQNFQIAWRFYQVIASFSQLTEDQNKRRLYSKAKAVQVFKLLKQLQNKPKEPQTFHQPPTFETPKPSYQPNQSVHNNPPNNFPTYQPPINNPPPPQYNPPSNQNNQNLIKKQKKKVDPERIAAQNQAITQLQNAVSELSFNRISYAREAIHKALQLLAKYE